MKVSIGCVLKVWAWCRVLAMLMVCGVCVQCSPQPSVVPLGGESSQSSEPDEAAEQQKRQAARRALASQVLARLRARKGDPPSFHGLVYWLLEHCLQHGPRVEIRFRWIAPGSVPTIDEELIGSPQYTGKDMLPMQYFRQEYARAREERLGRRLRAGLQAAFPKELVKFEIGERIEPSRRSDNRLPEVEVPTLFVNYRTYFSGKFFGREKKGRFVETQTRFSSVFRLPVPALELKHRFSTSATPNPVMIDEAPSTPALYEKLATKMDDRFSEQFFTWFFEPPSKLSKQPIEPFEPDPRYLDPTHDQGYLRFYKVGARCGPSDRNCLPMPYNGHPELVVGPPESRYRPGAKRNLVPGYGALPGTNLCSHDGECLVVEGWDRCIRWDTNQVLVGGYAIPDVMSAAYCGCVEGQCQWFTQTRRVVQVKLRSVKLKGWPARLPIDRRDLERDAISSFHEDVRLCFAEDVGALPRRISVNLFLKRNRDEQTGTIHGAPAQVASCIKYQFPYTSFSLEGVTDAELEASPVSVEAIFDVSAAIVP